MHSCEALFLNCNAQLSPDIRTPMGFPRVREWFHLIDGPRANGTGGRLSHHKSHSSSPQGVRRRLEWTRSSWTRSEPPTIIVVCTPIWFGVRVGRRHLRHISPGWPVPGRNQAGQYPVQQGGGVVAPGNEDGAHSCGRDDALSHDPLGVHGAPRTRHATGSADGGGAGPELLDCGQDPTPYNPTRSAPTRWMRTTSCPWPRS